MLHRIVGALLLVFIGVLLALKFNSYREDIRPALEDQSSNLKLLSVQDVQNQILKGEHKITLINLWASWCVPCLKELPDLIRIKNDFADSGLQLILISTDDEKAKPEALRILQDKKVDFETYYRGPQGYNVLEDIYPNWNGALPASLILDRNGDVLEAWFGETTQKQFEARIKKYL